MSLSTLRTAVLAAIEGAMPGVACEAHGGRFDAGELKRVMAKAPAAFVAALGVTDLDVRAGEYQATVGWGIFCLAKDRPGTRRDLAVVALVDRLARIVPGNTWATADCLGAPLGIRAENLFAAEVDKMGIAMWAVTWQQRMILGRAMSDEDMAALDPFATLYARYPLADDAPVAEDRVSLPQDGD